MSSGELKKLLSNFKSPFKFFNSFKKSSDTKCSFSKSSFLLKLLIEIKFLYSSCKLSLIISIHFFSILVKKLVILLSFSKKLISEFVVGSKN